jgi:hypothetical protein
VKYLILIYNNPDSRQVWMRLTEAQRAETVGGYITLNEVLAAAGEKIVSEALADPSLTKQVEVREGRTLTTDGPFAEVKEQLAGFYLIDCENLERAIEYAAMVPEARFGKVEVRPVMDLSALGI